MPSLRMQGALRRFALQDDEISCHWTVDLVTDYVTYASESRPMIRSRPGGIPGARGRVRCPRADLQPTPGRLWVLSAWHYDQAAMASLDWDR